MNTETEICGSEIIINYYEAMPVLPKCLEISAHFSDLNCLGYFVDINEYESVFVPYSKFENMPFCEYIGATKQTLYWVADNQEALQFIINELYQKSTDIGLSYYLDRLYDSIFEAYCWWNDLIDL